MQDRPSLRRILPNGVKSSGEGGALDTYKIGAELPLPAATGHERTSEFASAHATAAASSSEDEGEEE